MDEEAKWRCDTIYQLCKDSWELVRVRHSYAWRAAFSLWTAFGAFIAIALTHEEIFTRLNLPVTLIIVILIGGALCILHWRWLKGLGAANAIDREIAIHYEKILRELSGSEFPENLQNKIDAQKKKLETFWGDWSRPKQLLITVALCVVAILAVFLVSL
jgi:hypothetical protein